jgi:hypothetical protein
MSAGRRLKGRGNEGPFPIFNLKLHEKCGAVPSVRKNLDFVNRFFHEKA